MHEDTLNNRLSTSHLVRLVEGEERWETPDHSQGVRPQNWGGTEQNHTVTCMVLKAKANDRRKIPILTCEEFLDLMLLSISWHKQQQQLIC
ncbi:uncharacterized protein TNCV_3120601 [Trichonephila clavipes]|uniref:Uncharacterized protein n=1 Tax=Trichonephila clavipes TaxID=2585209 RepID=A0A8X7BGX8_TRICX|nr:uncharacterized protein TNCV_3120601 [Trichonephila clavipes]